MKSSVRWAGAATTVLVGDPELHVPADRYEDALRDAVGQFEAIGALHVIEYGAREIPGLSDIDLRVVFPERSSATLGTRCEETFMRLDHSVIHHRPFYVPLSLEVAWHAVHPSSGRTPEGIAELGKHPARLVLFALEGLLDVALRLQRTYELGRISVRNLIADLNSLRHSIRILRAGLALRTSGTDVFDAEFTAFRGRVAQAESWSDVLLGEVIALADTAPTLVASLSEAVLTAADMRWGARVQARNWIDGLVDIVRNPVGASPHGDWVRDVEETIRLRKEYDSWLHQHGFRPHGIGTGLLVRSARSRAIREFRRAIRVVRGESRGIF